MNKISGNPLLKILPFWLFILFFKFGAGLHYTLMAPLGAQIMDVWVIGLLVGGAAFLQLILDVPAGMVMDRYGYKRFLRITSIIFILSSGAMLFGLSIPMIIATLVLSSAGWLFFGPGVDAYLLSYAKPAYAGRLMSMRDTVSSVGIVLSTVLLGFVLDLSVQAMGVIVMVLIGIALFSLSFAPEDSARATAEKKHPNHHYYVRRHPIKHTFAVLKKLNPAAGMLLLLGFSASIFYATIWFVVPLLLDSSVNAPVPSIGLAIFDFSIVTLGFFLGRLADKLNQRLLVFGGLLIFAAAGAALGFSASIWFILLGFIATVGDELAGLTLWAWLDRLDKKHTEDGLLSGVITFFYDLGWTVGPIMAGFLFYEIGPELTMTVGAVPVVITWIASMFMVKPLQPTSEAASPKPHRRRYKS